MSMTGSEFENIWPNFEFEPSFTDFGKKLLRNCSPVKQSKVDVKEFIKTSSKFPLPFPTENMRVYKQPQDRHEVIAQQIASVYPIIHERTLSLYLEYLEYKCQWGSKIEKSIYKKLSLCDFVHRLLAKRCASFFGPDDSYLLLNGKRGEEGFEAIGSPNEKKPLVLKDVLSYDDIKLSALLSLSSHSEFINDGRRNNGGIVDKDGHETNGIIIGLIGGRFERSYCMEFQDIIIVPSQNTKENGYGQEIEAPVSNQVDAYRRLWKRFYESRDYLYGEVTVDQNRFSLTPNKKVFDNVIMKRRYAIIFDMLLLESEDRAAAAGKQAYIHVTGFGLGCWKIAHQQTGIFLETFEQRLRVLASKLTHIGVVHLRFNPSESKGIHDGAIIECPTHPAGGIRVHISHRNPAEKLSNPEHANMLLVVSYAWDGNALPGNEFWMGFLSASNDPATACSTLVPELHNPHINKEYCTGHNLHIASPRFGVMHISDYVLKVLN